MISRTKLVNTAVFLVSTVALPLLIIEGLFRLEPALLERLSYRKAAPGPAEMVAPHPKFGISGNTAYRGHDSRGFRNKAVSQKADIVVFGDSQTYGLNVDLERAWPQQLERKLQRHVYQFAIGGAGPFNHALMMDDALGLRPSIIVATVYFGNDLVDSYRWAHGAVPYAYKIATLPADLLALVNDADPDDLRAISRAENADPRQVRHSFLDCQSPRPVPAPALQAVGDVPELPILLALAYGETPAMRALLTYSVALRSIYVWRKTPYWVRQGASLYPEPVCVSFDSSRPVSTILAPAYRMVALDPSDARVREGMRLTLASLVYMRNRASGAGAQFLVVFIPTKELAFREVVLRSGMRTDPLQPIWNAELAYRATLLAGLDRAGIRVVDALPALAGEIASERNPYPVKNGDPRNDADGHPRAEGYAVIASEVAEAVKALLATDRAEVRNAKP